MHKEELDSGKIARLAKILLYLSGNVQIEYLSPNEENEDDMASVQIYIKQGQETVMELFEDEFAFLLEDKMIEFSEGTNDPELFYEYETYSVTDEAWPRFKALRESMQKQKTA